jgi:hypothetical protein
VRYCHCDGRAARGGAGLINARQDKALTSAGRLTRPQQRGTGTVPTRNLGKS